MYGRGPFALKGCGVVAPLARRGCRITIRPMRFAAACLLITALGGVACGRGDSAGPAAGTPASQPRQVVDPGNPSGGLGVIDFPTSGAPAAQDDFRRGVAWLHSFGYEEAIEAFQAAQAKDPDFALAYWGESLSFSQPLWFQEEPDKGRAALAKLAPTPEARAAKAATDREKGFLRAVEALWGPGEKPARRRRPCAGHGRAQPRPIRPTTRCRSSMRWPCSAPCRAATLSLPVREQAGAIADAVFARNPAHPGASHLMLHAYDHGTLAPRGLAAARAYAKVAPAASHALHMPAHFFVQLGHWQEAAASDEASWNASVAWVTRRQKPITLRDFHSLVWLHYELTQLGQFTRAQQVAAEVDAAMAMATAQDTIGGHHYGDSEIGRGSGPLALRNDKGSMRARYILESERWREMARAERLRQPRRAVRARGQRRPARRRGPRRGRARRTDQGLAAGDGCRTARAGRDPEAGTRRGGGHRGRDPRRRLLADGRGRGPAGDACRSPLAGPTRSRAPTNSTASCCSRSAGRPTP